MKRNPPVFGFCLCQKWQVVKIGFWFVKSEYAFFLPLPNAETYPSPLSLKHFLGLFIKGETFLFNEQANFNGIDTL
ncbi:MAG: hypothetical protein Ct9H300mP23_06930 [Nitrospinota bacterium]|nr:MAG: hypothetical protein Ct9H300mP23_06930 [Nitrospinota bacterium]